MMRFQPALACGLACLLVVPAWLGQGRLTALQDAHAATVRALSVLQGLEQRLQTEPAEALQLILSATEEPAGSQEERDRQLESLRNEVNLLQMELDAARAPVLAPDGGVQSSLGAATPPRGSDSAPQAGITTGLDESVRSLLSPPSDPRSARRNDLPRARTLLAPATGAAESPGESAYSADPLRHGITCYRAGRYAEALELLAPLDQAVALYWRARTLERLERLEEAIQVMQRAIDKGGEDFEQRRAQMDLEFMQWKLDFTRQLPASKPAQEPQ